MLSLQHNVKAKNRSPGVKRKRAPHKRPNRTLTHGKDALVFTLFVLRSGTDLNIAATFFGLPHWGAGGIFKNVVGHIVGLAGLVLQHQTSAEAQTRLPERFAEAYNTVHLRNIIDCLEIRIPKASNQRVARKKHSEYKHAYTAKVRQLARFVQVHVRVCARPLGLLSPLC